MVIIIYTDEIKVNLSFGHIIWNLKTKPNQTEIILKRLNQKHIKIDKNSNGSIFSKLENQNRYESRTTIWINKNKFIYFKVLIIFSYNIIIYIYIFNVVWEN